MILIYSQIENNWEDFFMNLTFRRIFEIQKQEYSESNQDSKNIETLFIYVRNFF
jgi:hypothetical protein